MGIANKPLIDKMWDKGLHHEFGLQIDANDTVPKDKTQVFVLSPEVALAAEKLVRSPSFKFPDPESFHMPYEHTVIEYDLTPDIKELRRTATIEGIIPISRLGIHVHEIKMPDKRNSFLCTPYWQFSDGRFQTSAFSFALGVEIPGAQGFLLYTKNTASGAVKTQPMPSRGLLKAALAAGITGEQLAQGMQQPSAQQHLKEAVVEIPNLMFASSMLLTCKSGVAKARVDARIDTTPGLGARRRKESSSCAYTLMYLSALESVNTDGVLTSNVGVAAHYVRGHFKQRKSGVYWWSPFVRGNGEPRKREAYIVEE